MPMLVTFFATVGLRPSRAAVAVIVMVWLGTGCAMRAQIQDSTFADRLAAYTTLRKEAVRAVGPVYMSDRRAKISAETLELATQLQALRQGAREGDLLGGPVGEGLRLTLRRRLARDDGNRIIARILDVQPKPFTPAVNIRYPAGEPRASTPAAVLRALPRLPQELSYRFVGRDLLLLDWSTGLILDVLRDALPPSTAAR